MSTVLPGKYYEFWTIYSCNISSSGNLQVRSVTFQFAINILSIKFPAHWIELKMVVHCHCPIRLIRLTCRDKTGDHTPESLNIEICYLSGCVIYKRCMNHRFSLAELQSLGGKIVNIQNMCCQYVFSCLPDFNQFWSIVECRRLLSFTRS